MLEFVIGDSGTAAEWKEANSEMVTLEDGSQEEQVQGNPDPCCICRQVYQQRDWWILNGGWNNLTFFWALAILFVKGRKVNFQRKILALNLIPQDPNFFLNNATARDALLRILGSS